MMYCPAEHNRMPYNAFNIIYMSWCALYDSQPNIFDRLAEYIQQDALQCNIFDLISFTYHGLHCMIACRMYSTGLPNTFGRMLYNAIYLI
jgi:hypothetical protein